MRAARLAGKSWPREGCCRCCCFDGRLVDLSGWKCARLAFIGAARSSSSSLMEASLFARAPASPPAQVLYEADRFVIALCAPSEPASQRASTRRRQRQQQQQQTGASAISPPLNGEAAFIAPTAQQGPGGGTSTRRAEFPASAWAQSEA